MKSGKKRWLKTIFGLKKFKLKNVFSVVLVVVGAISFSTPVWGQAIEWTRQFGSPRTEIGRGIHADSTGVYDWAHRRHPPRPDHGRKA